MEIRLMADGEEQKCNDLHNRIYNRNRSLKQWKWDFTENNYDKKPVPFVVVADNGAIVGTQAFIPIRMIDSGGVYWTAKSEETLLDPNYRGQKLFQKMYALLFEYAVEHDLAYIWGFSPAVKAFDRLKFAIPTSTEQLFLPFSVRSIPAMTAKSSPGSQSGFVAKVKTLILQTGCLIAQSVSAIQTALGNSTLDGIEIRTVTKPDEQFGELCDKFIKTWGGTTIYRDADYLKWRIFDNPYVKCVTRALYHQDHLLGWVAFAIGDDGMGYLVDLIACGDDTNCSNDSLVKALLHEAIIGTRNMGATGIRGWHVNHHPFDKLICKIARKLGFYHIKKGHAVVIFTSQAGIARAGNRPFDDWFVTRIYTEGVTG